MLRVVLVGAAVAAIALSVATGASAQARTSESFQFSDPLTGNYRLWRVHGHDLRPGQGHVKTWFDRAGDPIMQVGHIKANEVDTNDSTGKAILIRTAIAVHVDFLAGTTALSGARNFSTEPGSGVVIQHVGRVVIGPDGEPISLSGKFPEFEAAYIGEDFCAALA